MDVDRLAERLRDPDPRIRVETLRILAMVEETRALEAVRWMYKNDPEPGVREVASWAGRLIWAAYQRGHSTQRAIEELFARPLSSEHQELFLASLSQYDLRYTRLKEVRQYAVEQTYRRQLDDVMRGEDAPPAEAVPLLSPPARLEPAADVETMDERQLLDAGLSAGFWEK